MIRNAYFASRLRNCRLKSVSRTAFMPLREVGFSSSILERAHPSCPSTGRDIELGAQNGSLPRNVTTRACTLADSSPRFDRYRFYLRKRCFRDQQADAAARAHFAALRLRNCLRVAEPPRAFPPPARRKPVGHVYGACP